MILQHIISNAISNSLSSQAAYGGTKPISATLQTPSVTYSVMTYAVDRAAVTV